MFEPLAIALRADPTNILLFIVGAAFFAFAVVSFVRRIGWEDWSGGLRRTGPLLSLLCVAAAVVTGVVLPLHRSAHSAHTQQAMADLQREYPGIKIYYLDVNRHWANIKPAGYPRYMWLGTQKRDTTNFSFYQTMHIVHGHYWLTSYKGEAVPSSTLNRDATRTLCPIALNDTPGSGYLPIPPKTLTKRALAIRCGLG
jgi:hypothetical protein